MIIIENNTITTDGTVAKTSTETLGTKSVTRDEITLAPTLVYRLTQKQLYTPAAIKFSGEITTWCGMAGTSLAITTEFCPLGEIMLYTDGSRSLTVSCSVTGEILELLFTVSGSSKKLLTNFSISPTVNYGEIVKDLEFNEGTLKIEPTIKCKQTINVSSRKTHTMEVNCLALVETINSTSSGNSYSYELQLLTIGDNVTASTSSTKNIYIYLVFEKATNQS